jgi:CRP-like cAMP-binding protein
MSNAPPSLWMDYHAETMKLGPLSIFIQKLLNRSRLSSNDQRALAALPHKIQTVAADTDILSEGDQVRQCPILLDGLAYRAKVAADGGRQIVALKIPGDVLDFQSAYMHQADHDIRSLTPATLALVSLGDLEELVLARPAIARAFLVDTLLEGSIAREWLLNIGRRDAEARLAHLHCEIFYRIGEIAGLPVPSLDIPLKQEQLADLLGLTPVHINRVLKRLEDKGGVARVGRRARVSDLSTLRTISGFSDIYLHRQNFRNADPSLYS